MKKILIKFWIWLKDFTYTVYHCEDCKCLTFDMQHFKSFDGKLIGLCRPCGKDADKLIKARR